MILNQHAIMQHGESRSAGNLACGVKKWAVENNVITLPLAWLATNVDQGFFPAIERACLSIGVGRVFIVIEDLYLVVTHQKDAAVATTLIISLDLGWGRPLKVNLAGSKFLFRLNVAGFFNALECPIDHLPDAWGSFVIGPVFVECLFRSIK